jgi:aspartate ammonia-lyase
VLHGRKSISWAKSVLPLFTGASSETCRKVPDRVQIDTKLNRQNCIQNHDVKDRRLGLNRTAVMGAITYPELAKAVSEAARSGKRLGEYLLAKGLIRQEQMAKAMAQQRMGEHQAGDLMAVSIG